MSVASLSPPTPYTALMSLLSVALSSATAKSNSMILPDACRVIIQPARKACSISAESLLKLSGIPAQFRRFGCAFSAEYAHTGSIHMASSTHSRWISFFMGLPPFQGSARRGSAHPTRMARPVVFRASLSSVPSLSTCLPLMNTCLMPKDFS